MSKVPQFEVLQHFKVRLFLTHCGEGSVMESIYSKTLMALYPIAATQHFNGKRAEELGIGLLVKDREKMTDLTSIINTLLLDKMSSWRYQEKLNKIHKMLSFHGGVSEAVDFMEYSAKFGT